MTRNEQIYHDREIEKKTFKAIAQEFNICAHRVSQIYHRQRQIVRNREHEDEARMEATPGPWAFGLETRTVNSIRNVIPADKLAGRLAPEVAAEVAMYPVGHWLDQPNCGMKTVRFLMAWTKANGAEMKL